MGRDKLGVWDQQGKKIDLNVRPKTLKLLDDNIGEKLHNIRFDNDFLAMTPKHTGNKSKNR